MPRDWIKNRRDWLNGDDEEVRAEISAPEPTRVVPYTPVRCPECDSTECPVYKTKKPDRYHKCRNCGESFKSKEQ